jgi:hypothetical protein
VHSSDQCSGSGSRSKEIEQNIKINHIFAFQKDFLFCTASAKIFYQPLSIAARQRKVEKEKETFVGQWRSKKIYRLKEDQAFSLSLELGRREKFAWHPSSDFLLHSVGGGGDFVDTVIAF